MAVMTVLLVVIYPLGRLRGLSDASYTSVFQTSSRWNAFIALAIAEKISGPEGLALVALVMAVIVIPLNLINVAMLVWFRTGARSLSDAGQADCRKPVDPRLCVLGIAVNALPFGHLSADRTGRRPDRPVLAGAGAPDGRSGPEDHRCAQARAGGSAAGALKLVAFPVIMVALALGFGLEGETVTDPCAVRGRARRR
jgi:malonate transporter